MACVLKNDFGKAAQSSHPVTLYITVNITPPNLYCSLQRPTKVSPAEKATIPGSIQLPAPGNLLHLPHHQPAETGNTTQQSSEEMSPTNNKNPRFALHRADEAMKRIAPIDQSNTWERAAERVKWVMDTLGPIAEVRAIHFRCP